MTIFKEGDEATELYILTEGRVALEMDIRPVPDRPAIPTAVDVITKGESLGWSALVEPYVYTLSARCLTNCQVLALKGEMLRNVMADDRDLGYELMKRLAKLISLRLTYTRLRLTSGLGLVLLGREIGKT
jgi:CRP-like cAMP-binding protein